MDILVTAHVFLVAQRVAWVLNLCVQTLLIGAIIQRKLTRTYPFFLTYLVVNLGCSLALLHIPFGTLAYAASFRIYQSIDAVLQLGVAGEAFQRLCVHFRKFRGMGRFRLIMATMLFTMTGLFFLAVLPGVPAPYPHLVVIWIERWETAVLTVTFALSWWVLTRFLGLHPPDKEQCVNTRNYCSRDFRHFHARIRPGFDVGGKANGVISHEHVNAGGGVDLFRGLDDLHAPGRRRTPARAASVGGSPCLQ